MTDETERCNINYVVGLKLINYFFFVLIHYYFLVTLKPNKKFQHFLKPPSPPHEIGVGDNSSNSIKITKIIKTNNLNDLQNATSCFNLKHKTF